MRNPDEALRARLEWLDEIPDSADASEIASALTNHVEDPEIRKERREFLRDVLETLEAI